MPTSVLLIMNINQDVSNDVRRSISELPTNLKTRILY